MAVIIKAKPWLIANTLIGLLVMACQVADTDERVYAAMMHLVDRQVAELRVQLEELGLAENTLILLTGDNGGQDYFRIEGRPRGFFAPNVDPATGQAWRGQKGQLYEGGLRPSRDAAWQLYDLAGDPSETDDLADEHPGVLALLQAAAEEAHRPERRGEIYDEALARRDHTVPVNH